MVVARAVILAAGRGTRLGSTTELVPKPMLEIAGRPLIEDIVAAIAQCGVKSVGIVTGYLAPTIEHHMAANSPIPISFIRQPDPRGTGDAVRLARRFVDDRPFLLSWGDIATAAGHYKQVANSWHPQLAAAIGVNLVDDVSRHASVVFDDDRRIRRIIEKPVDHPPSLWNNSGLMVLGPQVWRHLDQIQPSGRGELELPDAINGLIAAGELLEAVPLSGLWFDIGTIEHLEAARVAFATMTPRA